MVNNCDEYVVFKILLWACFQVMNGEVCIFKIYNGLDTSRFAILSINKKNLAFILVRL